MTDETHDRRPDTPDRLDTTDRTDQAQGSQEVADHPVPPGSVVVGVDGSPAANRALAWAVAEATRRERAIHLLCARETYIGAAHLDSSVAWTDPTLDALDSSLTVIEEAKAYVDQVSPDLRVTFSRPWGRPAQHLVIASHDAEIVVVGSRGHGRLASVMLGTVSLQTAAHARCPVIVVREGQPEHPTGSLKITVGVDGSTDATEAVAFAMRMAGPGGDVDLVLAWWLEMIDGMVVTTKDSPPGSRWCNGTTPRSSGRWATAARSTRMSPSRCTSSAAAPRRCCSVPSRTPTSWSWAAAGEVASPGSCWAR